MNNFITLKTRVSMSFEHSKGIAAIAKGTPVRIIRKKTRGSSYLVDYGNGVQQWETPDFLKHHFVLCIAMPLDDALDKTYLLSTHLHQTTVGYGDALAIKFDAISRQPNVNQEAAIKRAI